MLERDCMQKVEYPTIEPVLDVASRPFWSVMIPVYNRIKYLERALKSVLYQDPGADEMQIEVVDDNSAQENQEQIINILNLYDRVSYYRQASHVGMSANWNTCIQRAHGYWVHILHDDDMILPGFYVAYRELIKRHPGIVLLFSPVIEIDENDTWTRIHHSPCPYPLTPEGLVSNAAYEVTKDSCIVPSSAVVRRDVYASVGGFAKHLSYAVDWEMWMRIARTGPLGHINHPYTLCRNHRGSATRDLEVTGRTVPEIRRTIEIGVNSLPPEQQREARLSIYKNCAEYSNYCRALYFSEHNYKIALFYAYWAFRFYPSVRNFLRALKCIYSVLKSVLSQKRNSKFMEEAEGAQCKVANKAYRTH